MSKYAIYFIGFLSGMIIMGLISIIFRLTYYDGAKDILDGKKKWEKRITTRNDTTWQIIEK